MGISQYIELYQHPAASLFQYIFAWLLIAVLINLMIFTREYEKKSEAHEMWYIIYKYLGFNMLDALFKWRNSST